MAVVVLSIPFWIYDALTGSDDDSSPTDESDSQDLPYYCDDDGGPSAVPWFEDDYEHANRAAGRDTCKP